MRGFNVIGRTMRMASYLGRRKGSDPRTLTARLNPVLSALSSHVHRLEGKYRELETRSKEYFENCVRLLKANDTEHAALYASEIAELRKLAKMILHTKLLLEQVKIRVETIVELSEAVGLIVTLKELMSKVASEVRRMVPDAALQLEEFSKQIDEIIMLSNLTDVPKIQEQETSDEAARIIEEARLVAAKMLRESFPEVPMMNDVEKVVYEYLSNLQSVGDLSIDVESLARDLNLPAYKVEEALESLEKKGLLEFAELEAS